MDQAEVVEEGALREGRLRRLQASMRERDLEASLLFHEPNIRYATGATAMPVWSMTTFVRCALVPAEGEPVLFEHGNSIHRSRLIQPDVRPMASWEFVDDGERLARAWAGEIVATMHELGVRGRRIALDRLGTPGYLALKRLGLELVDAQPAAMAARHVKTPEEIALLRANGALIVDMLGAFEAAIEPGVTERGLLGVLGAAAFGGGAEYLATTSICSGPNTNPWRAEATDRAVEAGDLVWVDTDTVGIGGYFSCVSRTFAVGDRPTDAQRAVHDDALSWLREMEAFLRPGLTMRQVAEEGPKIPEPYVAQRYECTVHGIGLEEESPSACHPLDPQPNPDVVLEPGMTLVIELYAGEVGAQDGVKLGDQVLVTEDGLEVLAPYPFASAFA